MRLIVLILFLLSKTACSQPNIGDVAVIYRWNDIGMQAAHNIGPALFPPMLESRMHAMTSIAIHNLINTLQPKYDRYQFSAGPHDINGIIPNAAIAAAAYTVYVHEMPAQKNFLDSLYQIEIETIGDVPEKAKSVDLGILIAKSILRERSKDKADQSVYPVEEGSQPGAYRFTPPFGSAPFNTPPYKGLLALPGWGQVQPFVLKSGRQFRPEMGPYPTDDPRYTEDYNEIKEKGCEHCPARTPDQTELAKFWVESSCLGWNRIAILLSKQKELAAPELSRLLMLLHIAIADSYIACMESKMHFYYWRPVTAIHSGAVDDNPLTTGNSDWKELGYPTPPVPDYPSAHASAGGAAAEVLRTFFHSDTIPFTTTSTSLPGITRTFNSLSLASLENALSRIYIGYHFRHAAIQGELQGIEVGKYVMNSLYK